METIFDFSYFQAVPMDGLNTGATATRFIKWEGHGKMQQKFVKTTRQIKPCIKLYVILSTNEISDESFDNALQAKMVSIHSDEENRFVASIQAQKHLWLAASNINPFVCKKPKVPGQSQVSSSSEYEDSLGL